MTTRNCMMLAVALAVASAGGQALAQENIFKLGVTRYTTDSKTTGVKGVGVPPGADAETGDATTLLFIYERRFTPNLGAQITLGLPPRIHARATGSVAFLGDDVLSAKNVTPTVTLNYHFGQPGDTWRPYVGAGINYTRFVSIRSTLADDVKMKDSVGLELQAGLSYAVDRNWGLFASVARIDVKTDLVAVASTVLTTHIDFRPVTYSFGAWYRF